MDTEQGAVEGGWLCASARKALGQAAVRLESVQWV